MNRRDLLKATPFGVGAVTLHSVPEWLRAASAAKENEVDVLVVGGGTAGTIAALQSAKAGASTMIIEMAGQLGGTTTTAGVNYPGLFHAWEKQVIAGLGWELVLRTVELDSGQLPDFSVAPEAHFLHQVRINAPLYAALAEEACLKAGVVICFYEMPVVAKETAQGWIVETVGKGTRRKISCRQLIDCTGGADIIGMLGMPRLREDSVQPGTLIFRFGGFKAERLDGDFIQRRYREAVAKGELQKGDYHHSEGRFLHFLQSGGENAQHVFGADSSTAVTKTQANLAGRASVLRLLRFIRSLPGCEHARLIKLLPETGVRETYRIVGEIQITHSDYTSGRRFEDAIAYSFYPIDVHDREGVVPRPLQRGVVPTIPLRALIPQRSRNLLVAGRSVSSDRLANSALRVQASCMAMGQAAGAAAALAVERLVSPGSVSLNELRSLLRRHGAIVPS